MLQQVIRTGLIFALCATILSAQEAALTNEMVIKMVQSGLPTDTIVRTINLAPAVNFGFLPSDLAAMSSGKVPDEVFKAMARRDKTVGPASAPAPVKVVAPAPAILAAVTKPAPVAAPATDEYKSLTIVPAPVW
jgi:hypothetical protein